MNSAVPIVALSALPLSSCAWNYVNPEFHVFSDTTYGWLAGNSFQISCSWKGYFFDDVENPVEMYQKCINDNHPDQASRYIDFNGYEKSVEIDWNKNNDKIYDEKNKSEYLNINFDICKNSFIPKYDPNNIESFNFFIYFRIKHTNFVQKQQVRVEAQPEDKINFDWTISKNAVADDDYSLPNLPTTTFNAISCMNGTYNIYKPTSEENVIPNYNDGKVLTVEKHIKNDMIYYINLLYKSLSCLLIVDNWLMRLYAIIGTTNFNFHMTGEYDLKTMVFKHLSILLSGTGDVYWGNSREGSASINYEIHAGSDIGPNYVNKEKNGIQFLGAYQTGYDVSGAPDVHIYHFPTIYDHESNKFEDKNNVAYKQVFLSTIPLSKYSFNASDITINVDASKILYKGCLSSGWTFSFFNQPRTDIIDPSIGLQNTQLPYGLGSSTNMFNGEGFNIASYLFSGCKTDKNNNINLPTSNWTHIVDKFDLKTSPTDVNSDFLKPKLQNKINPNHFAWDTNQKGKNRMGFVNATIDNDITLKPDEAGANLERNIMGFGGDLTYSSCYDFDGGGDQNQQPSDKGTHIDWNSETIQNWYFNKYETDIKPQLDCVQSDWKLQDISDFLPAVNPSPEVNEAKQLPWWRVISQQSFVSSHYQREMGLNGGCNAHSAYLIYYWPDDGHEYYYPSWNPGDASKKGFDFFNVLHTDECSTWFDNFNFGLNYVFTYTGHMMPSGPATIGGKAFDGCGADNLLMLDTNEINNTFNNNPT